MRRFTISTVLAALALAACGGGDARPKDTAAGPPTSTATAAPAPSAPAEASGAATTTTAPPPAPTTTPATTTTTEPPLPTSPLNGLPVEDGALLDRRVMAVKIDNHPRARPQSGIDEADAMVELLVEGGFTRFISLFHHSDSEYLGPVRSGRPTDPGLLRPLGATFTISGAQNWVAGVIVSRGVNILGEGPGTFRIGSRSAPHNLYASTTALRTEADERGFPDEYLGPLYEVAPWDERPEAAAETVSLSWASGNRVTWTYEGGKYHRWIGTSPMEWVNVDGETEQIAVDVLVVIAGTLYTAGPGPGQGGSAVPATETTGAGWLLVFSEGAVVEGTWERDGYEEPFRLFDSNGDPLTVPPGIPWISVFPASRSVTWS